jgi:Ca2+-binding EF-hand superfamily protein
LYLLSKNAESIPHSRGEAVLARIQDAAIETANAGRPFLALCSLTDQKLTGFMSPAELLHTFKMMGITVTPEELRSIQELLPSSAVSKEGNVDYRELFWIVQTQTTQGTQFYPDTDGTHRFNFPPKAMSFSPNRNASNPFSTFTPIPSNTTRYLPELETVGFEKSIMSTPIGTFMSTPLKSEPTRRDHLDPPQKNRHISEIFGKVKSAISEKNRLWGTKFHLQKQFEVYDGDLSGYVSLAIFQTILDDLSVPLSASEIYTIRSRYGRSEYDAIDYLEFCQDVNSPWEASKPSPSTSLQTSLGASRTFSTSRAFLPPPSRLSETLRSLRNSGRDPRDIFQAYDLDNTGMVTISLTHSLTLSRQTL